MRYCRPYGVSGAGCEVERGGSGAPHQRFQAGTDWGRLMEHSYNPVREGLDRTGLYHSFRLPDGRVLEGAMPLSFLEDRVASFGLPQDLRGKRVLDIGPWDGYFTFEME